jgi:hypothetical protein
MVNGKQQAVRLLYQFVPSGLMRRPFSEKTVQHFVS